MCMGELSHDTVLVWFGKVPMQDFFFFSFFLLFIINSTKTTNMSNCHFFEWLIKNLKWLPYFCALCVQLRRFKSSQELFRAPEQCNHHLSLGIYLYAPHTLHKTAPLWGHINFPRYMRGHVTAQATLVGLWYPNLGALIRVIMPSGVTG